MGLWVVMCAFPEAAPTQYKQPTQLATHTTGTTHTPTPDTPPHIKYLHKLSKIIELEWYFRYSIIKTPFFYLDNGLESPEANSFFQPRGGSPGEAGVTSPLSVPIMQLYREPDDRNINCFPSLLNVNELGTPWKYFEYAERVERQERRVCGKVFSAIFDQLINLWSKGYRVVVGTSLARARHTPLG